MKPQQRNLKPEKIQLIQRGEAWQAMFTFPQPNGVIGCPLGTGLTQHEAMTDLLERTNRESGTDFVIHE